MGGFAAEGGVGRATWRTASPIAWSTELTTALAAHWRHPADEAPTPRCDSAAALVVGCKAAKPAFRLEALRLLMLALGDWRLKDPPAEVYTGYSLPGIADGLRKGPG